MNRIREWISYRFSDDPRFYDDLDHRKRLKAAESVPGGVTSVQWTAAEIHICRKNHMIAEGCETD